MIRATDRDSEPPLRERSGGGRRACPSCGHSDKAESPKNVYGRALAWYYRTIWRLGPACEASIASSESANGYPDICGCPDTFHVAGT